MVGYDHRWASEPYCKPLLQPSALCLVDPQRVGRLELPSLLAAPSIRFCRFIGRADQRVVVQQVRCHPHCSGGIGYTSFRRLYGQLEVCAERGAQEPHAVDHKFVTVEQMDVAVYGFETRLRQGRI